MTTLLCPVAPDVAERFWAKVDRSGECWLWTAARNGPVPVFAIGGTPCDARRVAWEFTGRGSLEGLTLRPRPSLPRCRGCCVRPEHHDTVPSRQPQRSRGILALMAERAERRGPVHTIATQPGGPLGGREVPPDDTGGNQPVIAVPDRRPANRKRRAPKAPRAAVVGPFAGGGFVAVTPWGAFNGDTMLAACALAEAGRPPTTRSQ